MFEFMACSQYQDIYHKCIARAFSYKDNLIYIYIYLYTYTHKYRAAEDLDFPDFATLASLCKDLLAVLSHSLPRRNVAAGTAGVQLDGRILSLPGPVHAHAGCFDEGMFFYWGQNSTNGENMYFQTPPQSWNLSIAVTMPTKPLIINLPWVHKLPKGC